MSYNYPNKDRQPGKSSLSPSRSRPGLTAANLNRRPEQYGIENNFSKNLSGFDVKTDSSNIYKVKDSGKGIYHNEFSSPYGPSSGPRATTVFSNNPDLPNMFASSYEEWQMSRDGNNPDADSNVYLLNRDREIPVVNRTNYGLNRRGEVASLSSKPYVEAEEAREAAEYAKKSCWGKLMECFNGKQKRRGGSFGGGDVTIKDLREFLDTNPDINNILVDDKCPLNPTQQMIDNVNKFTGMLENYENQYITIDKILYDKQEAGKRRRSKKIRKTKKTRKTMKTMKTRKTKKNKR